MKIFNAKEWLERIHALKITTPVRIMNVCGGHERTITAAGLRTVLPKNIAIIPGPGCPVCVCPEEDLFTAIQLSLNEAVTLLAFGDLLRVPINVPRKEARSLEEAKARGADIRPVASPREALRLALNTPKRQIILFAAGFETTMAPVAAMVAEEIPNNLQFLLTGRRTWPAVAMLLATEQPGFDALVAPGHVATVMGAVEWNFVADQYKIPTAIAGFTPVSLLAAIYSILRQLQEQCPFLDNCYPEAVRTDGNGTAKRYLQQVFNVVDAKWRGIGNISQSGFTFASDYSRIDARLTYPSYTNVASNRLGAMPPGCECAKVLLGKLSPSGCRLFGTACRPSHPVGPCMVSDEGACQVWHTTKHL